jgi:hypothetical protein
VPTSEVSNPVPAAWSVPPLPYATSQEGLNLAVLLATLVPAGMVKEEDTAWTFESLLRVSLLATPDKPLYLFTTVVYGTVPTCRR